MAGGVLASSASAAQVAEGGGMTYNYNWLHIPTGKRGVAQVGSIIYQQVHMRVQLLSDREYFLEWLDRQNAARPGVWQYWNCQREKGAQGSRNETSVSSSSRAPAY
jgi:hypothetical protein